MSIGWRSITILFAAISFIALLGGCGSQDRPETSPSEDMGADGLGRTIGSLTEVLSFETIPVEGYGIVTGLHGKGCSETPAELRRYFHQYILGRLPRGQHNVSDLLNSKDTAVVRIRGRIPPQATRGQSFDITVSTLSNSQATSIQGGWLLEAELTAEGTLGRTLGGGGPVLARAKGPVYIDQTEAMNAELTRGHILGGGSSAREFNARISLVQPDFRTSAMIRNRINERFGSETASALSANLLEISTPPRYHNRKERFISLIRAMYLTESEELIDRRIEHHTAKLGSESSKYQHELALEAIGTQSLEELGKLLDSSNKEVRFSAARAMLYLGDDDALEVLKQLAIDKQSPYRVESLQVIRNGARRNDAINVCRELLEEEDFQVRLQAYKLLVEVDDTLINQRRIGGIHIDIINESGEKAIYASRSGEQRIAIFSAPIECKEEVFIRTEDGDLTINATAGDEDVWLIREHPRRTGPAARLRSSRDITDIIETLAARAVTESAHQRSGLNVSYGHLVELLSLMAEKGAIDARFELSPLP